MNKEQEKTMIDLERLMQTQVFKTEEDVRKFMDNLIGNPIPNFPKDVLTKKEQAVDLVYHAHELPPAKGRKKLEEALKLDPDCIEVYEFLGNRQATNEAAAGYFEKGIAIGRRLYGEKYRNEHKGMFFWLLHETRPFMRCMQLYADCLFAMEKVNDCAVILEEMLTLNPNDNQGVRDLFLLCLIELDERKKFIYYAEQYKDDGGAFCLFNLALFSFKTEGETVNSNRKLKEALKNNKHVAPKIIAGKYVEELPELYGMGDSNEADYYVFFALDTWRETKGAVEWLIKLKRTQ